MKRLTLLMVPILALALCGCAFFKAPSAQQLATYKALVTEAVYVGGTIDMQDNPDHRPIYIVVQQTLASLQTTGDYDQGKLMEALSMLPVGEFKGERGAFYVREIVFAWSAVSGLFYDPGTTPPWVKATIDSVKGGLDKALEASPAAARRLKSRALQAAPPARR